MSERSESATTPDEQFELGSLLDLKRIATIEVPTIGSIEEFQSFLIANHVTESFATAIYANASGENFQSPAVSIGQSGYPEDYAYKFDAMVSPDFYERVIKPGVLSPGWLGGYGPKVTAIRVRGQRKTASRLFDYNYFLSLPIKMTRTNNNDYSLETALPPEAWYQSGTEQVTSGQPGPGRRSDLSILPLVSKEAALDLHDAVKSVGRRRQIAAEISNVITEQIPVQILNMLADNNQS